MSLTVEQLQYQYPNSKRSHYTFTLHSGEITGLLGANGAGKSTLLKLLVSELNPVEGSIKLNQKDLISSPAEYKMQLGYMPDVFPEDNGLTVKNFLHLVAYCKYMSRDTIKPTIDKLLHEIDLQTLANKYLNQLSLGQKQRLLFAQATLNSPKCLILDEPLNGLDPSQQEIFWQQLAKFKQQGVVLIASHHLTEILQHCDRILLLDNHQLVMDLDLNSFNQLVVFNQDVSSFSSTLENHSPTAQQVHKNILALPNEAISKQWPQQIADTIIAQGSFNSVLSQLFQQQQQGLWQW